jgi:hypothetical protein
MLYFFFIKKLLVRVQTLQRVGGACVIKEAREMFPEGKI